jgi:hypothetical protein
MGLLDRRYLSMEVRISILLDLSNDAVVIVNRNPAQFIIGIRITPG